MRQDEMRQYVRERGEAKERERKRERESNSQIGRQKGRPGEKSESRCTPETH